MVRNCNEIINKVLFVKKIKLPNPYTRPDVNSLLINYLGKKAFSLLLHNSITILTKPNERKAYLIYDFILPNSS